MDETSPVSQARRVLCVDVYLADIHSLIYQIGCLPSTAKYIRIIIMLILYKNVLATVSTL